MTYKAWPGRPAHRAYVTRFLPILLLVAFTCSVWPLTAGSVTNAKPEDVGLSPERLAKIHDAIQQHVDAHDISGAVTLVARRGRIAHFEAQGLMDLESKRPMSKDGIFRLASMSKPITGVAVLMLMEDGKLRLSDPVSRFIPAFKNLKVAVPKPGAQPALANGRGEAVGADVAFDLITASREITIRDLLTHTSGLVSGGLGTSQVARLAPRGPADTLADYVPRLAIVPLDFQPGTLWRYSGQAGFDVLSRIVEVASGQPYDVFLKQRLFDQLGMKDTGFVPTNENSTRVVTLYQRTEPGLERAANQNQNTSRTYFSGAAGLMSTAEDYLQFAEMLLNGGELNGKRLLSPRTVELMSSNHVGDLFDGQLGIAHGVGFGLSVQVVQDPAVAGLRVSSGAFGWRGAYGTDVSIEPKERMVSIIMISTNNTLVHRDFENAVRQAIVD
jgi:CubicO group peptidase (beta-lactamase class C family)